MASNGVIQLYQFHYENRNKHIQGMAPPSNPTIAEMNYSYAELGDMSYEKLGEQSSKIQEIEKLLGKQHKRDIKHLDSACMAGCHVFLTSDKDDLVSKRDQIIMLLGINVFHFQDGWGDFIKYCANHS